MMIVTPKQFRGLFLATFLVGGVLIYSTVFFFLYMGWGWEEVARSVPSPDLPPIPAGVWHLFELAVGGLAMAIIVVGLARLAESRRRAMVPALADDAYVESELKRLQDVEQENARYATRNEVAWGTVGALRTARAAMQEAWLADRRELAKARETIRLLGEQPAANAPHQAQPAPTYPDLRPRVIELEAQLTQAATATLPLEAFLEVVRWARSKEKLPVRDAQPMFRKVGGSVRDYEAFAAAINALPPLLSTVQDARSQGEAEQERGANVRTRTVRTLRTRRLPRRGDVR